MTMMRAWPALAGLTLAIAGVALPGPSAAQASRPNMTLQMPATPEPARVTVDPKTTALIVLDFVESIRGTQAGCTGQMLPAATPFLERARKAGMLVAYGTRESNMNTWLKPVAPAAGDLRINSQAQDRFYNTGLDAALKAKGIKTVILIGWKVSGSVTYTAVGAMVRDYTVVVPMDTTAAATPYETAIGSYNLLNSGNANLANEAMKARSVTLSRTDLIGF